MSEAPGSGRSPHPAPAPAGAGWWRRALTWLVRTLGGPELEKVQAALAVLQRDVEQLAAARRELQHHADTRIDQTLAEVAELRHAYLATRGEFDAMRQRLAEVVAAPTDGHDATMVREALAGAFDRLGRSEHGIESLQRGFEALQSEVEAVRDRRLPLAEEAQSRFQASFDGLQRVVEEVRDERLPALSARVDALVGRLHEELEATAALTDRLAAREPVRVTLETAAADDIPEALRRASEEFVDRFRGSRDEISDRVADYLPLLRDRAPVLDLGCGRGELLAALQDLGVEGKGVDADPAMVASCRRRGLSVVVGDVVAALREQAPDSLGAVCAIHLLEHLPAATWMQVVDLAARALRPSGLLIVECPNPEALRVCADLFWIDPTHVRPVHPEALRFAARAVGLEVLEVRRLRPFPPEQALAGDGQPAPVRELAARLDALLSGPRDYAVIARKRPS